MGGQVAVWKVSVTGEMQFMNRNDKHVSHLMI